MSSTDETEWVFETPPEPKGAFISTMRVRRLSTGCEGSVEIELWEPATTTAVECHVDFIFSAPEKKVEPLSGIVLGGDAGERFVVSDVPAKVRSLPTDHPLIRQLRLLLNDARIVSRLEAFAAHL